MKRILFFLLMCMLLVACADKRQGQIEKVLFMLNRSGTYYEMTTSNGRRYYLNVDSLLDHIDTAYIKTCKAAIALPVVQPLLDSLCSDKELYEFTGRQYSPVVRFTATDALIRRKYAHLEQILLSNYADTTMINVCADDVGWEEHTGSVFYVIFSRAKVRSSSVGRILCVMTLWYSLQRDCPSINIQRNYC